MATGFPGEQEVRVVVVGGVFREILDGDVSPKARFGGSGLVASLVCSRLGASTALVSYVGSEDASAVFPMLEAAGVDTNSVSVVSGASGTFVFPHGEDRPWPMYRPAEAAPHEAPFIPEAAVYIVFGIPDFDPVAAGWLDHLPTSAILIWDRQGWISRARDYRAASSLAPLQKIYVANLDEVLEEFSIGAKSELWNSLPPYGFSAAIVKEGTKGCTVIESSYGRIQRREVAGFPIEVSSTVGSGDAFVGGAGAGLASDAELVDAVRLGNASASAFLSAGGDPLVEGFAESVRRLGRS